MRQPVVVVDANQIIERDWRIDKPLWEVVLGLAATGQITLFVTEVVVRECVGKFRSKLTAAARDVTKLGIPVDVRGAVDDYEAVLRGRLADAGAIVSSDEPLTLIDLVDQAIARTRPFDGDGNGFRDAILWAHVRKLVDDGNQVVFLALDNDFLEEKDGGKRLHSDLAATVTDGMVQWFPDIRSWFAGTQRWGTKPKVEAQLLKLIQAERAQFETNVILAVQQASATVPDVTGVEATIDAAMAPVDIVHTSLVDVEEGDGRFLARMIVHLRVEATVRTDTIAGGAFEGDFTGPAIAEAEAFFDADANQIDSIRVEVVELDAKKVKAVLNAGQPRLGYIDALRNDNLARIVGFDQAALANVMPKLRVDVPLIELRSFIDMPPLVDPKIFEDMVPTWTLEDLGIDIGSHPGFETLRQQVAEQVEAAWRRATGRQDPDGAREADPEAPPADDTDPEPDADD
jgi:hypothetical protein